MKREGRKGTKCGRDLLSSQQPWKKKEERIMGEKHIICYSQIKEVVIKMETKALPLI